MLQEDNFPDKRFVGLIILQGCDCEGYESGFKGCPRLRVWPILGHLFAFGFCISRLVRGRVVGNWQGLNRTLAGTEWRYYLKDNALNSFSYQPMRFEWKVAWITVIAGIPGASAPWTEPGAHPHTWGSPRKMPRHGAVTFSPPIPRADWQTSLLSNVQHILFTTTGYQASCREMKNEQKRRGSWSSEFTGALGNG